MSPTLKELDNHLSECADIIRNAVDKTDYKDFILPLVFYRTLNDTYQDRYAEVLEEEAKGVEELARKEWWYDFVVPPDHSWEELRKVSTNVDEALNDAFGAIVKANPTKLEAVFSRADYVDEDALDDDRLASLIDHLSVYNLSAKRIPPDMLGEAYMDLVRHFATEEGKDGGEFFTPPEIVALQWEDVDLENRSIHVRHRGDFKTKGNAERRVPIRGDAEEALVQMHGPGISGPVFTDRDGEPIRPGRVTTRFKDMARKADLDERIHFHSLRHTTGSWLSMRGVPMRHIQAILGHSDRNVTEKYSHLAPETLDRAMEETFGRDDGGG